MVAADGLRVLGLAVQSVCMQVGRRGKDHVVRGGGGQAGRHVAAALLHAHVHQRGRGGRHRHLSRGGEGGEGGAAVAVADGGGGSGAERRAQRAAARQTAGAAHTRQQGFRDSLLLQLAWASQVHLHAMLHTFLQVFFIYPIFTRENILRRKTSSGLFQFLTFSSDDALSSQE